MIVTVSMTVAVHPSAGEMRTPADVVAAVAAGRAIVISGDVQQVKPPGLGDMVASGLASVGITKKRVQAVASKVGIKDCGCAKRQQALNEFGKRLGIGNADAGPSLPAER